MCQLTLGCATQVKDCAAIDRHSIGKHVVDPGFIALAFESAGVSRIRVKGQASLDRQPPWAVTSGSRGEERAAPASGADRHRTDDVLTSPQGAGVHVHRSRAGG